MLNISRNGKRRVFLVVVFSFNLKQLLKMNQNVLRASQLYFFSSKQDSPCFLTVFFSVPDQKNKEKKEKAIIF